MKNTKFFLGAILGLGMLITACEKEEKKVETADQTVAPESDPGEKLAGEERHTIGYYHNEILDDVILTYREVTPENEEEVYGLVKDLAEGYMGGEAFDYADYTSYRINYIPNSSLTMEEAELRIEGTLITDMAVKLNDASYISDSELAYYESFNDAFYATTTHDEAQDVVNDYITEINSDESLSESELTNLNYSFDIGKYSLQYWNGEFESGARSLWPVFSEVADERRGGWIRVLLKVGADICGGAVGGGIGFAIGGPVGAGVGAAAGGAAASVGMFN